MENVKQLLARQEFQLIGSEDRGSERLLLLMKPFEGTELPLTTLQSTVVLDGDGPTSHELMYASSAVRTGSQLVFCDSWCTWEWQEMLRCGSELLGETWKDKTAYVTRKMTAINLLPATPHKGAVFCYLLLDKGIDGAYHPRYLPI